MRSSKSSPDVPKRDTTGQANEATGQLSSAKVGMVVLTPQMLGPALVRRLKARAQRQLAEQAAASREEKGP